MDHLADAPIANILILAGVIFLAVGLFGRVGGFIGSIFGNIEAGKNSRVLAGVLGTLLIVGGGWLHEDSHKSVASTPAPAAPAPSTSPGSGTSPAVPRSSPSVTPDVVHESPKLNVPKPQPSPKAASPSVPPPVASPAAERENLPTPNPPPVGDEDLIGTWTNLTPRSDSVKRLEVVRSGQGLNVKVWYSCPSGDCDVGLHRLVMSGGTPTYEYNDSNRRRVCSLNKYTPNVVLVTIDLFEAGTQNHRRHDWLFVKSTLSDKMQSAFARYFDASTDKAFAMAPGGAWFYQAGSLSVDEATQKALRGCERRSTVGCRIILLNNGPGD